jgi:hypothetical protein
MTAVTTTCVSPGAMLNGPVDSMRRRSAGLVSSQPVPATGSPALVNVVISPVMSSITGEPSAFRPFM